MKRVLGIDTSCYTTSVALADAEGQFFEKRKLLDVGKGERGIMQSNGVFQHVQNLPELMESLMREANGISVSAVCASTQPRERDDSYMPVFTVGTGFARSIAATLGVPFYATSHQQGHVRAAMLDSGIGDSAFLGIHLSGGTTEVFRADRSLKIHLIGGTGDISAGQLVDRIGVMMGMRFPAGAELERLAYQGKSRSVMPTSVRGTQISFSGAEAQAVRMLKEPNARHEDIAAEVFSVIARSLAKQIDAAARETHVQKALLAGGVASSTLLRLLLQERLNRMKSDVKLYWARPELAGDNAVGVAVIGAEKRQMQGGQDL